MAPAATLLAMPNWSADGWDVPSLDSPDPNRPSRCHRTTAPLHHCRDDDAVSFDHLALNFAALPQASVHEYPRGGHQFDGVFDQPRST